MRSHLSGSPDQQYRIGVAVADCPHSRPALSTSAAWSAAPSMTPSSHSSTVVLPAWVSPTSRTWAMLATSSGSTRPARRARNSARADTAHVQRSRSRSAQVIVTECLQHQCAIPPDVLDGLAEPEATVEILIGAQRHAQPLLHDFPGSPQ